MMNSPLQIGTCGLGGSKAAYARLFSCVEIQQTFYQPPQLTTLQRWRAEVPTDFEFTLKAWQLITHPAKSPTYKRLKRNLSEQERAEVGYFKSTAIVEEAWHYTLACAQALGAKRVLFQCPASFTQTPEHIQNLVHFFSRIERKGLTCCWEPRGPWDKPVIKALCQDLDLWHVVDPFTTMSVTPEQVYFRLHGRQGWRYQYESDELSDLTELIPKDEVGYVFFNNIHMRQDALLFKQLLKAGSNY
ncbi:DUF72 domain-containing protein [Spirosoma utsteinense]|uniref:DUF72 domain-containing protein n=1 Tax=Spirosoma utsteinense TaxID=2585773 RepID=A0ABR6W8Y4_9BACT|nr:DUF72 domain-containing protein [Spirosoma utsteinense]MBC3789045.1 putative protein YecE (DUF72 family) [Spirosoma utsteinense]MBC3792628.1 putative protein YecE (DUF72 family) [Spirosoma utsteinense]